MKMKKFGSNRVHCVHQIHDILIIQYYLITNNLVLSKY